MIQPRGTALRGAYRPVKFVSDFAGTRGVTNDQALQFVKDQLIIVITGARRLMIADKSLLQIAALTETRRRVRQARPRACGVAPSSDGRYNINFSPEKMLRSAISEMARIVELHRQGQARPARPTRRRPPTSRGGFGTTRPAGRCSAPARHGEGRRRRGRRRRAWAPSSASAWR
jgi:hypothetical protein